MMDWEARLARLNDAPYLAFKADEIAAIRAYGESLPKPCELVEIGSNRGKFALGLAELYPGRNVLAIEWRRKWMARIERAKQRLGRTNLYCLRADARIALPILAPPHSIEQLFVLYPDPWWKRRHENRRLLDAAFFEVVSELMACDGTVFIKTDVRLVAERVRQTVARVDRLEPLHPWDWPDERGWAMSTREEQCLREGVPTFRLYYRAR